MKKTRPSFTSSKVSQILLKSLLFLLPIVVLPFFSNPLNHSKSLVLFLISTAIVFVYLVRSFRRKKIEITWSPVTAPLILFGLAVTASTYFTREYPLESIMGLGGVYIAFVSISILGGTMLVKKEENKSSLLSIAASIVVVCSILDLLNFGPTRFLSSVSGLVIPKNFIFTLVGSTFQAVQLLILAFIFLVQKIRKKKIITAVNLIAIPLILFGIAYYTWTLLPGKETSLSIQAFASSWSVALDSIRYPRAALIGNGPESYMNVYSFFKPLAMNNTPFWNVKYINAFNTPLTMLPTIGVAGLLSWIALIIVFVKQLKYKHVREIPETWVLLASFFMQLLAPTNIVILIVQGIAFAFWIAAQKNLYSTLKFQGFEFSMKQVENAKKVNFNPGFVVRIVVGILLLLATLKSYSLVNYYSGSYLVNKANRQLAEGDLASAYTTHQKAVSKVPYLDSNRRNNALIAMNAAIAISKKESTDDTDSSQMATLINKAVKEGTAATIINPDNTDNWMVLAQIYRELIGTIEKADEWTVQSYIKAVNTDPMNPTLRMDLGDLYFNYKDYEKAAAFYNQAISLKPDAPNAYYQLGKSAILLEQPTPALAAWQQALSLIPRDDENYQTLKEQVDKLAEEVAVLEGGDQSAQGNQGQEPSPIVEQNLKRDDEVVSSENETSVDLSQVEVADNQEETEESSVAPTEE